MLLRFFVIVVAAALHEDDAVGGQDGSVKSGRSSRSRGGSSRRYASGQDDIELPLPPGPRKLNIPIQNHTHTLEIRSGGVLGFGPVGLRSVRFGSIRFGSVRFGSVRFGCAVLLRTDPSTWAHGVVLSPLFCNYE